ncbi:hypothetical protein RSAG8_08941, partial [Rhizoctonia solani AG-8 WAC10335]
MSQCLIVSGTPQMVPATQVSWVPLDATPYMLQAASIVQQSQEPSLGQLSPETLKRRLNLLTDEEGSSQSSASPPRFRRQLQRQLVRHESLDGGASTALSMAQLVSVDVPAHAGSEVPEDIGVLPIEGWRFQHKGKCYLLTYAMYVRSEDTPGTSHYETIKELVDHLYGVKSGDGSSLLQYVVGVTESHDLKEGQWSPDWHCHVIVWAQGLISSEALNLWKFKGVQPHDGGFPPLAAFWYLKKEPDAFEAHYGNLTEEFLQSQGPSEGKEKHDRNEDFTYAMEAPGIEEFYGHLRERQPRDLAMGFNSLQAFAKHHYKDASELPDGVCAPKELKRGTINLPDQVMPWVTSNILEHDPDSDHGRILVLWGPSETGKSALACSFGHHIRFRQNLNSDQFNDHPMVQYAILDDMDWSKVSLKMWVQEDFNFHTSYRSECHCKWGCSTIICSNSKPSIFADCNYSTSDGKDWIDTNCTFVYIGDKLY